MPRLVAHSLTPDQFDALKAQGKGVRHLGSTRRPWPEPNASWVSQLLFSFVGDLLDLGATPGRTLAASDLFDVPEEEAVFALSATFREIYRYATPAASTPLPGKATDDARAWRLAWGLWPLIRPIMLEAGQCNFVACTLQVAQPLLLRELVLAVSEPDPAESRRRGLRGAAWVLVLTVVAALAQQRQLHLAMRSGQRLRALLVAEIFDVATRLTPTGQKGISKGEVNNLVAVDTQKVLEVTLTAHLLWSSPLQVIVVSALLLDITGPTAILGIGTLVVVVPIAKQIMKEMLRLRTLRMKLTDERVRVATEVLGGIRVSKLNGWEPLWLARLESIRGTEVQFTGQELFVYSCIIVVAVSSPVVALLATISTRMLVNPDARLSAPLCFATLGLISSLRFPINHLGELLGKVAQAWKSLQRISHFLERETAPPQSSGIKPGGNLDGCGSRTRSVVLRVAGGAFSVGGSERDDGNGSGGSFSVRGIDLEVREGDLVCVVGTVASGKSTLLDGLQGNATQVAGTPLNVSGLGSGATAFAAQSPFVLNATVKENVLFGRSFDAARYAAALRAASLAPDLKLLPAGDATEIGERGVTLSGGQKARVGLARCVYGFRGLGGDVDCHGTNSATTSTLALLDDPLGALDASTALKVFDGLFGLPSPPTGVDQKRKEAADNGGALRGGGTILVTHAVHFLPRPEVTRILVLTTSTSVTTGQSNGEVAFNGTWHELVAAAAREDPAATHRPLSDILASAAAPHNDDEGDGPEAPAATTSTTVGVVKGGTLRTPEKETASGKGSLIKAEEREEGVASTDTWLRWVQHAGGWRFFSLQVVFLLLDRGTYAATEWWLTQWTDALDGRVTVLGGLATMPSQGEAGAAWAWCRVYFALGAASIVFCFSRTHWGHTGGVRAAASLYAAIQKRVLLAPMSFFDTTPLGRLLVNPSYHIATAYSREQRRVCIFNLVPAFLDMASSH